MSEETVMTARINDLSELSHKLNEKSDALNEIISSVNAKLAKLNLGVEVWLDQYPIEQGDKDTMDEHGQSTEPYRSATLLGYSRVYSEFELAVKDAVLVTKRDDFGREYEEVTDPTELKPLLKAPRNIRAGAMRLIPDLLDRIKQSADSLLRSIEDAQKAADKL